MSYASLIYLGASFAYDYLLGPALAFGTIGAVRQSVRSKQRLPAQLLMDIDRSNKRPLPNLIDPSQSSEESLSQKVLHYLEENDPLRVPVIPFRIIDYGARSEAFKNFRRRQKGRRFKKGRRPRHAKSG